MLKIVSVEQILII